MKIDLKQQIIRGGNILDEGKFNFDRTKYLNASEADQCIRQQWYAKHNAPAEAQDWGFARRGTHAEKFVYSALTAANVPLLHHIPQVSLQDGDISATPDGVIAYDDEWIGLEIKSFDPRKNTKNFPTKRHSTQLKIGMELLATQLKPVGIKMSRGILMYINASNFDDVLQYDVKMEEGIVNRYRPRAKKVLHTEDVAMLDREGKSNDDCKFCPYKGPCGVTAVSAPAAKVANRGSNLDGSARRYMEIKDGMDQLKAEQDVIKEEIKAEVTRRGVGKVTVGNISVDFSVAKGRSSLDKKAVAAAGIDLTPFETIGNPVERLTLKRV